MQIYPPGTRIGQYEIASNPMIGGMGVVYFCLDHGNNDRPVALKTFKPEYLPDRAARDRFLREGTAWVDLGRHPHIVRCYEVKYIDPTVFLSLELIAKEQGMDDASLRSWMGAPMPVAQALLFALQIARGMKYATEKIPGLVHRDLKPENVLVGADKLPGTNINRLRVTDFGLAAILKDENGRMKDEEEEQKSVKRTHLTHGIVGTPLYMAPEQWMGEPVGVFTDVYALGCILYEMVSGQFAVKGKTNSQLQEAHCSGKLQPRPKSLPKNMDDLLAKCLALNSSRRYGNWDELIDAIERAYSKQSGISAPRVAEFAELSQDERIQEGWSYNAMGTAYLDMGNVEVAAGYFEKALSITQETGDRRGEGMTLGNLGNTYRNLGDARQAIEYFEQALAIACEIENRDGEGATLGNLGLTYAALGNARRAIEYYEQQLVINREIGNRRNEGAALGNLGVAYKNLGDARQAIGFYEQALSIDREIGDRRNEGAELGNMGIEYAELGDARRAIGYYEQALAIAREIGDLRGEVNALGNLGNAYAALGDARRAIEYMREALQISSETGNVVTASMVGVNLGMSLAQSGNINEAISVVKQAIQDLYQAGYLHHAQKAERMLAQLQGGAPAQTQSTNPAQAAFEAFQRASNPQAMQAAVRQYSLLKDAQFIQVIEKIVQQQVPPEHKSDFEQRLAYLKQIARK